MRFKMPEKMIFARSKIFLVNPTRFRHGGAAGRITHKPKQTKQPSETMKTKTNANLATLIDYTNIPPELVRAVVRQFGGWRQFVESAPDVCQHGIDGGFGGFTYYSDTEPFARRNRAAIAQMAETQADDFGIGLIEMIQGFGCFRHDKPSAAEVGRALYAGESNPVLNALAWYAGEEVCRAYCDAFGCS